jgi:hypothetical protein
MKVLNEFAWVDDNEALHIDVPAMLKVMGVPDTDENRERYTQIAAEHLQRLLKDSAAIIKITD